MHTMRYLLLLVMLGYQWQGVYAQKLPPFAVDRRMDKAYMDSISLLARQLYQRTLASPTNTRNDTTCFEVLYYSGIHKIHENRQNWQQSLSSYKRYVALADTARNAVQSSKLTSMNQKSKLDQLTLQSQLEQQTFDGETRLQQRIRLWLLSGLVMLLLFIVALARSYRKIQRQKQQIQQLNTGLEQTVQVRTAELLTANDDLRRASQTIRETDARIIRMQEAEHQRIAADLHDDLGGTLSIIRRRLADIRPQLQDPGVARQFDELEPLVQKSSADLRRIAHNLMPPEFNRLGLHSALEQLVNSQPAQPTRFSFITSGTEHKLPANTELNVYRIVSELIQNINKHTQAKRAAVQLLYHPDRLTITVEDDGLGKRAVSSTNKPMGIGLKNSNLRAEYIGATLWRDASEGGTLIVLDVPFKTPDAASTTDPDSAD